MRQLIAASSTVLGALAAYSSGWLRVSRYPVSAIATEVPVVPFEGERLLLSAYSDVASGVSGLVVDFSLDGVTTLYSQAYSLSAATLLNRQLRITTPFVRVTLTNGALAQTTFSLGLWQIMAEGDDLVLGSPDDAASTGTADGSVIALLKGLRAIFAGTSYLGTVGGNTTVISQTPAISAAAIYAAKEAVGGKLTFANAARVAAGSGIINSVVIIDNDGESAELVLALYQADFVASADNAPFDPTDADNLNLIGHVKILAADYQTFTDNGVATVSGINLPFKLPAGTSIYGQLMCTGAPTYTAVTDLTVKLGILQD